MFSFLKKTKTDHTICVCLVNSYAITGAVVKIFKNDEGIKKPIVLFSCEEKIPTYHQEGMTSLEELVVMHTKKVLEKCRSFHGNFDKVVCTLGEPWGTTLSRTAHLEKREEFKITQKMIDEMIAREKKLFEQELVRNFSGIAMGLVGQSMPIISVNGYSAFEGVIGTSAKTIDVNISFAIAHTSITEHITGACADVFHHKKIIFESMDIARALLIPKKRSATIVHIGGTTSQISIVAQGQLTYTASIPTGLLALEMALEEEFSVPSKMIPGVMRFASDEKILEHERDVYYGRISFAYEHLGKLLHFGMKEIKKYIQIIPEPVFVIANPSWVAALQSLIQKNLEMTTSVLDYAVLDDDMVYTHDAKVRHMPLSIAILQATQEA